MENEKLHPNRSLPSRQAGSLKVLKLLLKIAITVLCFWYISTKIDFSKAYEAIKKTNGWWLIFSVATLTFSKLASSFRLNIYLKSINIYLSQKQNWRLYWLGMFYNLFLPGAISGDAYKVILLTKKYNTSYKKTTTAILLDRFSGLLALGLILAVYAVMVLDNILYVVILIAGSLLAVAALYFVIRYYFKDFLQAFWSTFLWGLVVQFLQVVSVYGILAGLHIPLQQSEWIFIFLLSAVITVLPISLGGGLGTREFVFLEGARYFSLGIHVAPVISILIYLSHAVIALGGTYFMYHDPLKEEQLI
ncbi:MAG: flippase-like domain-containing protein [Sphingobacteriales bacterium]|nr:flippase-like domain-containing protein [Sphingobacteriales bacterium]